MLLATFALMLVYAVVGLGCAAAYENGKAPRLMRSGMIIGLIGLLGWIACLLMPGMQEPYTAIRVLIWTTVWPCLMTLVGLLLLLPLHSGWRWWCRALTFVLLASLALFVAGAFSLYPADGSNRWEYENDAARIGWALALVAAGSMAATLVVGIAGALTGRAAVPTTAAPRAAYWLACPRCGREQEAFTGDHHCIACNLRTRVEFT
jgi:hypothetical protein